MADDLCPECIDKLRRLAELKMSMNDKTEDEKKLIRDAYSDVSHGDISLEVKSILDEVHEKLIAIGQYGGARGRSALTKLKDGYNTAVSHYTGRDFVSALDNVLVIAAEVNSEYSMALANTELENHAQVLVNEAERDIQSLEKGLISSPAPPKEREQRKTEILSALSQARGKIASKDYKGAIDALRGGGGSITQGEITPELTPPSQTGGASTRQSQPSDGSPPPLQEFDAETAKASLEDAQRKAVDTITAESESMRYLRALDRETAIRKKEDEMRRAEDALHKAVERERRSGESDALLYPQFEAIVARHQAMINEIRRRGGDTGGLDAGASRLVASLTQHEYKNLAADLNEIGARIRTAYFESLTKGD